MSFFAATPTQSSHFLRTLGEKIVFKEFGLLRLEAGFAAPNDFPIEAIIQVVKDCEFPKERFYDYEWAIYECEFDRIRAYSGWMQLLLSSLYVYCNKRKQWGTRIESDYYYLVIELALEEKSPREIVPLYLSFIEWLYDQVKPDAGYDDYYALLSWTFLRRLSGSTEHPIFYKVLRLLIDKNYSREEIAELTVSARGADAWLDLHRRIPCPERLKNEFEQIIEGLAI